MRAASFAEIRACARGNVSGCLDLPAGLRLPGRRRNRWRGVSPSPALAAPLACQFGRCWAYERSFRIDRAKVDLVADQAAAASTRGCARNTPGTAAFCNEWENSSVEFTGVSAGHRRPTKRRNVKSPCENSECASSVCINRKEPGRREGAGPRGQRAGGPAQLLGYRLQVPTI